jgi:Xaa-Pro aminopeptidase
VKVVAAGGGRDTLIFFNGEVPSDKPVELEDVLGYHMEICGPSGHWCELTLTLAFREPTDGESRLMDTELRAYERIRQMAKPGVKIRELAEVFEMVLQEDGWQLADDQPVHYDFHGQGMDVIEWPYYGPLDSREGDAELREGMIFSYHPRRKVIPEVRSTGFNEDILITKDGAARLSGDWGLRWRPMT